MYFGYPKCVSLDQGPLLQIHESKSLRRSAGLTTQQSVVESHNYWGSGERYHAYLRNVYTKVGDDFRQFTKNDVLILVVKAFNDTAGPSGLVPTLLIFGVCPRLHVHPNDLPEKRDLLRASQ